ncbi:hypothetical protein ALC60_05108 [Trachymyrmex zeteki]|uniref:Methyltransferase type 12 domain-containing protein n=1 Tax=Mycetomoellerius zeteki TaxID=64791 RepID=A0A151X6L4_9HYME|nr:PREDICTED: juvenile hormone acid O-methyltransferase-like [Trachymyrmex zeteki]KYQ55992.1 hypothetical protein ALC60_05108 [Trachymyrmex zeteki]
MTDNMQKRNMEYFIQEFDFIFEDISGKCMNVGSNSGEVTRNMLLPALNQDAMMIGTDASENMVEYANMTHGIDGKLRFETLDIQTKDLPEKYIAEFDHVFSCPTLHFCNDIRQGLENIYNMLRPGGTFSMLWVSSHDMFKILEIMAENKRFASYLYKYIAPFPNTDRPQTELKELLRSIGFIICHYSNREMINIIENKKPHDFLPDIMSAFSFLHEMPSDRAENFKMEFIREYSKITEGKYMCNSGKPLIVDIYKVHIAYARKQ